MAFRDLWQPPWQDLESEIFLHMLERQASSIRGLTDGTPQGAATSHAAAEGDGMGYGYGTMVVQRPSLLTWGGC